MNNFKDVELRVCKKCDAPHPCSPDRLSSFNLDYNICDDCYSFLVNNET